MRKVKQGNEKEVRKVIEQMREFLQFVRMLSRIAGKESLC
jgi:hypothetical protein